MPEAGVASQELHVESVGAGPPLVLLHGWALHSGLWMPVLARLGRRFRVHAVDLPGHGFSPPLEPYTLAGIADAVAHACQDLDEPATVLGWSLGGAAAMQWALRARARVARLVLMCTTPCFAARPDWTCAMELETLRHFGDELETDYEATLQRFVALQVRGSANARATLGQLRSQLFARGRPAREALRGALALLEQTDLRGVVPAIAQPSLVIAGERDTLAPAAAGAWLADALPAGRYAPIAHAAHAPFLSHPDEFFQALEAFVDGR
jgi:pimeloyl-[acyl-carrier protein] methyl ester esterase